MTPNQMQNNAAALMKLYSEAEQVMLEKLSRRLAREIDKPGWATKKYAEIKEMQRSIAAEIERLERESKPMRDDYIEDAYNGAVDDFNRDNGQYLTQTTSTPEARMNAITRLIQEQDVRFNALNSAILRDTQDEYRSIIGKVVAMQATGVITTREALRKALNDFAERGITGFTDKAGRKWEMDSYAEMAVRTGMMNARVEAYKDEMKAHDEHLVIISDHQDTCPLCAEYERAILSVDGQGLDDPECDGLLDDAVAGGLFHPNCGHSMTVYVKGLTDKSSGKSRQGYTKEQDEEGYKNRQIQRSLERKERMWKREMAVAKGSGDARRERFCYDKAMMYRDKIEMLVNTTGLPRKKGREGDRIKLSAAAKKVPKTVPQSALMQKVRAAGEETSGYKTVSGYHPLTAFDVDAKIAVDMTEEVKTLVDNVGKTITKDFPELDNYLSQVAYGDTGKGNPAELALSIKNGNVGMVLALNKDMWKDLKTMHEYAKKQAENKEHINSSDASSIVAHEYGHAAYYMWILKNIGYTGGGRLRYPDEISRTILNMRERELESKISAIISNHKDRFLSARANDGFDEFVSEAFADYYYGDKKPVSEAIVSFFMR